MTANRAASIRARLKQHADATKQDFNLVLTRYGIERLLYRLSISEHAPHFLLKGALLFQLWYGNGHRPTRDADLLGFGPHNVSTLVSVFRSIGGLVVDDGIAFDADSVTGSEIRKDTGYGGVRIDLKARLDRARIAVQLDIGFGDAVTILGMTNSRMKDFFDLWVLLRDQTLQRADVHQAIEATFTRRQTPLPSTLPAGLSDAFANDGTKQLQWSAFLRRNHLDTLDLAAVILDLQARLQACGFPRR